MAAPRDNIDPYIPMEAALAQPAPEEKPPEPIHVGPVTLRSLFRAWGRVLKKHFWWGAALMVIPTIASNAAVLLPAFEISAEKIETIGAAVPILMALPLQLGASGALIWRLVGSGAHGPLQRGPIDGLFWGFRFAGVQFAYGLLIGLVTLPFLAPATTIYYVALKTEAWETVPLVQAPTGWIAFAAASVIGTVLATFITSRWAIGAEVAVARDSEIWVAMKQSSARVKPRKGTVFVFICINILITTGLTYALAWAEPFLAVLKIEAPRVVFACSIASILVSLIAAVVGPAAHAALYFALRDPADPQEVLA